MQDTGPYDGPADGAVSALVENGLRAAEKGDRAAALAQIFALPPEARPAYLEMLAAFAAERRGAPRYAVRAA